MESAAPCLRAHPVDLRWLLSVALDGLFALLLLLATSSSFQLPSSSATTSCLFLGPAASHSSPLPPLFIETALSRPAAPPPLASPPRFAYVISGSALSDREGLAAFVAAHPVLAAAGNIKVVEKAIRVTYRGPTMVTTTLHAASMLLWGEQKGRGGGADWDWFINLFAFDYPLVTLDDLMHVFSKLTWDPPGRPRLREQTLLAAVPAGDA